jgi:hypothetical protein
MFEFRDWSWYSSNPNLSCFNGFPARSCILFIFEIISILKFGLFARRTEADEDQWGRSGIRLSNHTAASPDRAAGDVAGIENLGVDKPILQFETIF